MIQGMQTQSYKLEVLAQANAFLRISNSSIMAQLSQMTVKMNAIQAQMKMLAATSPNPTITKRKVYC